MSSLVKGIHHVTGAAVDPQQDYDFYTKTLGLRMVKKTINHETANQWHLFYADYDGNPGTVMTNFIFKGTPFHKNRRGRGSLSDVAFSVAKGSLGFWQERLHEAGCETDDRGERFGERVLHTKDYSGIDVELIECDDERNPPALSGVPEDYATRGFHSVTMISRIPELSIDFFTKLLRYEVIGQEGNRTRLGVNGGGPNNWLDILDEPDSPWNVWGLGGLHHVAFTIDTKAQMEMFWQVLGGAGHIVTDLRDRKWFHSMYMTEPGGINVEFSDVTPGWTVDEPLEELGKELCLPKQWADHREEIERKLEVLTF